WGAARRHPGADADQPPGSSTWATTATSGSWTGRRNWSSPRPAGDVSPASIENALRVACSLIGHVAAIGDNRPGGTALVILGPDAAAGCAARQGLTDTSAAALAADPEMRAGGRPGSWAANERRPGAERVTRRGAAGVLGAGAARGSRLR